MHTPLDKAIVLVVFLLERLGDLESKKAIHLSLEWWGWNCEELFKYKSQNWQRQKHFQVMNENW